MFPSQTQADPVIAEAADSLFFPSGRLGADPGTNKEASVKAAIDARNSRSGGG